jgi:hypothetical protein
MVDFLCDGSRKTLPGQLVHGGAARHKNYNNMLKYTKGSPQTFITHFTKDRPRVITLAEICRLPVQYSVEKLSKLLTHIKHYIVRTIHKTNNIHEKQMLFFVPVIIHE